MVRLELNGHPNFMKDGKILLSPNEDNRLSWTEDGKTYSSRGYYISWWYPR